MRTTRRLRHWHCSHDRQGPIKGKATPVALELTDFNSVVACADAIRDMNVSIDMLILNAGIILGDWLVPQRLRAFETCEWLVLTGIVTAPRQDSRTSNCLTPGPVDTNIRRDLPSSSTPPNLKSPAQGAATVCYVAAHPTWQHVSGEYFADCNPAPQSKQQTDRAMAAKSWQVSTELTRRYLT